MIRKLLIRIKCFFIFIGWTWNSPFDISENWQDMSTRYYFETDTEMIKLQKEVEEILNNHSKENTD